MTPEEVKKLLEKTKGSSSKSDRKAEWIRPPTEANKKFVFRILPYTDKGDFTVLKWYHWGIGDKMRVECSKDGNCPICDVLEKYKKDNWKKITRYLPRGQAFFNVQIPEESDKVYLMSMSESFLDWLMNSIIEEEIEDMFDVKNGRDVIVWRKNDKGAFDKMISIRQRPIAETDEEIEEIMSKVINLDNYFKSMTDEDRIKAMHYAQELDKKLRATIVEEEDMEIVVEEEIDDKSQDNNQEEDKKDDVPECFGNFDVGNAGCLSCKVATICMTK